MRKPASHDILIRRGDDFDLFFKIRAPITLESVDVTGWTGRAQIRTAKDAADPPAATFTVSIDQVAVPGGVLILLDKTTTAALPVMSAGVYDVELTDADGKTLTWLEGKVTVEMDVTR